jgi:hypothetical protein
VCISQASRDVYYILLHERWFNPTAAAAVLQEGEVWAVLISEIQTETSAVAQFLIDREIEAPERYSAVQSYRVAMAVLRQQRLFVEVRGVALWQCRTPRA